MLMNTIVTLNVSINDSRVPCYRYVNVHGYSVVKTAVMTLLA